MICFQGVMVCRAWGLGTSAMPVSRRTLSLAWYACFMAACLPRRFSATRGTGCRLPPRPAARRASPRCLPRWRCPGRWSLRAGCRPVRLSTRHPPPWWAGHAPGPRCAGRRPVDGWRCGSRNGGRRRHGCRNGWGLRPGRSCRSWRNSPCRSRHGARSRNIVAGWRWCARPSGARPGGGRHRARPRRRRGCWKSRKGGGNGRDRPGGRGHDWRHTTRRAAFFLSRYPWVLFLWGQRYGFLLYFRGKWCFFGISSYLCTNSQAHAESFAQLAEEGCGRGGNIQLRRMFTVRFVFDTSELRNFMNHRRDKATVDVRGICLCFQCTLSEGYADSSYTYRRGLLRCSFCGDGQCEGLEVWDE